MNKEIKPIENFCLSEHTNNLYKKEAGSAIALARDVAKKLNEVILAFNELAKNKWEKIHEQDGKIRKAILYMKDNLLNTINTLLNTKGDEMIDNAVKEYLGTLKQDINLLSTRLNNLLGSIKEGSTTLDAELIDLRVDIEGITYASAGESIRQQIHKRTAYASVFTNKTPDVKFTNDGEGNNIYTLTIPATFHVYYNNKRYDVSENKVITYSTTLTPALLFVFFNLNTNELRIGYSGYDKATIEEVQIGSIVSNKLYLNNWIQSKYSNYSIHDNPYFVNTWCDGFPYFEKVDENGNYNIVFPSDVYLYLGRTRPTIPGGSYLVNRNGLNLFYLTYNTITSEFKIIPHNNDLEGEYKVFGFVNFNEGVYLSGCGNPHMVQVPKASLILGGFNNYVLFDNVNKTITFPNDTLIMVNKGLNTHYYGLFDNLGNLSVSYADHTTSALVLYFNRINQQLEVHRYDAHLPNNYVMLCSFRTTGVVDISVPYKWNGKPFNLDLESEYNVINDNPNIKSINHRGYIDGPENTLSAYKLSAKNGFKYVECDVSFTKDNVGVLLHDNTIDRTSNGTGYVADLTYDQLLTYDFGSWKSLSYSGEKIPTFEQFISLCKKLGLHPYIELKSGTQAQINNLVNIVKRYGMINNITWISFNMELLSYISTAENKSRLGVCTDEITESLIESLLTLKNENNEVFIDCSYSGVSSEGVELCISNNLPLEVWTINDESVMLNINPYISGVSSDNLHVGKISYKNNC